MRTSMRLATLLVVAALPGVTAAQTFYDNDFEVDDSGWNVFGVGYESVRVASGSNGVTSASGGWHCETVGLAAGNWGGYSGIAGCASTGCATPDVFPTGGYVTSIDIYLDVGGGFANDSRFDFSSAVNDTTGTHRRDFIFNGSFLDSSDLTPPGAGVDRFVLAASNNAPGWPQGGVDPIAITTTGWYTFEHHFYDSGAGVLACDFVIRDSAGDEVASWTRSDASDVIGTTVGGNRYAWFVNNALPFLAFDNASRQPGPFDQDVTPDTIFGSGNTNGSFTVDRQDGVELGLRGKLRYPPSNIFNSNGDGSYTFNTGPGTGAPPNSEWSFEFSVNTDYDGSSGLLVGDLTYEIGMDNDPGAGADYLSFDPISVGTVLPYVPLPPPIPFWDHSMGDNSTAAGMGVEAPDAPTYLSYLATYNVAQNSWRPTFYQNTTPFSWDGDVPGTYEYYLAAFSGGTEVARTAITIHAVTGMTLSLEGDTCQVDQDAGLAGIQVEAELWLRNPDDMPVTGYQAFLSFDETMMTYEGAASSYSPAPFEAHIQPIATANVATDELRLDGNTMNPAWTGDALLATLVFTVTECDSNTVSFDLGQPFSSEVSTSGTPYVTALLDSSPIVGDITAPVLAGTPANITQPADAGSCTQAVVSWTDPTATDNCDPSPTVVCSPASGSAFPVGTTTVTCTATDDCGNESTSTFDVTVTTTNLVSVDIQLVGTGPVATTRCIQFVTDDCGVIADIDLPFDTSGSFSGDVEIPCGVWTSLCAKDQQHTLWDSTSLTVSVDGSKYESAGPLALEGGDTDNDGDVDINDVTLFLLQFGNLASPGGCPWDTVTRDSDFSNNGAVGSEDYTFLTSNWLTLSSCPCTIPVVGGGHRQDLRTRMLALDASRAVDYNRDGWIDWRDVAIVEQRAGLPTLLSARMRSSR